MLYAHFSLDNISFTILGSFFFTSLTFIFIYCTFFELQTAISELSFLILELTALTASALRATRPSCDNIYGSNLKIFFLISFISFLDSLMLSGVGKKIMFLFSIIYYRRSIAF